jgi:hypothetical protein
MKYNFCPFCAEETTDDMDVHGQNCSDYQESLATNNCPFCSSSIEECFNQAHLKFRKAMKSKSKQIEYPKLENEDFAPIKNATKIWEFFLFNKKDKIAKCTICSITKSVLNGTQGLNSHLKARHPNIFESFKENLMALENIKTPSNSKKSIKKTIKKSKCEPSADILEENINSTNPKKREPSVPRTDETLWEQILGYETENTFEANFTQADLDFVLL